MFRQCWVDALLLVGIRLFVSALVWWSGFRAVSDDDYARVLIAQKFATAPALDPSGTSWLPFPFWVQGGAMGLFGPELRTATVVAWLSGVASTLVVWLAARTLGLGRLPAFFAAILASAIAYSAWLGVATVPELLTASFTLYGAATLASNTSRERSWGALALCCATLSRYETWPVAAVFTGFCLRDAFSESAPRQQARRLAACAFVASAGMLLWLAHGVANHGSATFFVARVADYQKALGGHDFDALSALARHPRFVVEHAPALTGFALLGGALIVFGDRGPTLLRPLLRPLLACAALLTFLIVGDLRGAGATHHPARTLLPVWFLACIVVTATWTRALANRSGRLLGHPGVTQLAMALVVAGIIMADGFYNGVLDGTRGFVDRSDELSLGEQVRRLSLGEAASETASETASKRVLIAPQDYGYFAMIVAVADPARVDVFDDHDPRRARQAQIFDPDHAESLERRLTRDRITLLVVPRPAPSPPDTLRLRNLPTTSTKYKLLAVSPGPRPHG